MRMKKMGAVGSALAFLLSLCMVVTAIATNGLEVKAQNTLYVHSDGSVTPASADGDIAELVGSPNGISYDAASNEIRVKDINISRLVLLKSAKLVFTGNNSCGELGTESGATCAFWANPDSVFSYVALDGLHVEINGNNLSDREDGDKTVYTSKTSIPKGDTVFYFYRGRTDFTTEKKDGALGSITVAKEYVVIEDGIPYITNAPSLVLGTGSDGDSVSIHLHDTVLVSLKFTDTKMQHSVYIHGKDEFLGTAGASVCGTLDAGTVPCEIVIMYGEDSASLTCDSVKGSITLDRYAKADTVDGKTVYSYKKPTPTYYFYADGKFSDQWEEDKQPLGSVRAASLNGITYDTATGVLNLNNCTLENLLFHAGCKVKFSGTCKTDSMGFSMEDANGKVVLDAAAGATLTCGGIWDYTADGSTLLLSGNVTQTPAANWQEGQWGSHYQENVVFSGAGASVPSTPGGSTTPGDKPSDKPAQPSVPTTTVVSNDSAISVAGAATVLTEGTSMKSEPVASGTPAFDKAKAAVVAQVPDISSTGNVKMAVYELTLSDADNKAIHDLGGNMVSVTMPVPISLSNDPGMELAVYRVNEDGTLTRCSAFVSGGKVTFTTNHFSTYIFVEVKKAGSDAATVYVDRMLGIADQIAAAADGSTIIITKNDNMDTLPRNIMQALVKKGTVSLKMEYTYQGKDYSILIPAGKAQDNDIAWYGPLYLASFYEVGLQDASGVYTIQRGDSLYRIAAKLNTTVKDLLAKNPQIKDPNKIYAGKKISY